MIWRAFLIWVCFAFPGLTAPVAVTSGEHDGFTRLVLDFGAPVDWQMGRTTDGYALQLRGVPDGAAQPYDLTQVFKLIGKGRLAAIWADPQTMQLNIGIACACHAIPFEFRAGIVVIDLRDGAPPKGSSFELAMDGLVAPVLDAKPAPRPRARPSAPAEIYDWKRLAMADLLDKPSKPIGLPSDFADPTLMSLRDSLVYQLSRGASQGVVDLVLPAAEPDSPAPTKNPQAARVGLGSLPGLAVGTSRQEKKDIAAKGEDCPSDKQVNLSAWGTDAPIASQMADAMIGLIQEFDQPDPIAVERAIRFNLFLGYGIEARGLMQAFATEVPDKPLLTSISYILDQESDPRPAFQSFAACDSSAALWAVLSDPAPMAGDMINAAAVSRAFSLLPVHLRRHLGPELARRFLAIGDERNAQTVRNAIKRAPGKAGPQIDLLEAQLEMSSGDPAAAEARLTALLAESGPAAPAALVALVEARVAQNLPVEPDVVTALESILTERIGTNEMMATRRALLLARAASGDFAAAFVALAENPDAAPDLWRILSKIGSDQAVLEHSILSTGQKTPIVSVETGQTIARRLLDFGLPDPALRWMVAGPDQDMVLLAQIQILRQDGRAVLAALADVSDEIANPLRAVALKMLGEDAAAAQTFAAIGETESERQISARSGDWPQTAKLSPDDWAPVVDKLKPAVIVDELNPKSVSLSKGRQIADVAAQTRADVDALLAKIPAP